MTIKYSSDEESQINCENCSTNEGFFRVAFMAGLAEALGSDSPADIRSRCIRLRKAGGDYRDEIKGSERYGRFLHKHVLRHEGQI